MYKPTSRQTNTSIIYFSNIRYIVLNVLLYIVGILLWVLHKSAIQLRFCFSTNLNAWLSLVAEFLHCYFYLNTRSEYIFWIFSYCTANGETVTAPQYFSDHVLHYSHGTKHNVQTHHQKEESQTLLLQLFDAHTLNGRGCPRWRGGQNVTAEEDESQRDESWSWVWCCASPWFGDSANP